MKRSIFCAALVSFLLCPLSAHAGKLPIFQGSAGALFTATGDLWTQPSPALPEGPDTAIPFNDTAGGYGFGGGMFFEARFIKYIGLEIGLLFQGHKQWFNIEINSGLAELRYWMRYTDIRLPILIKGVYDARALRVSLGIGPEIVWSRANKNGIEDLKDNVANIDLLRDAYNTKEQNDVFFCVALGFAFKVWKLSIPLNLRYSHNLTQPKSHEKRLGRLAPAQYDMVASQSMDLSLQLGLAYDF